MSEVKNKAAVEARATAMDLIWSELASYAIKIAQLGGGERIRSVLAAWHEFQTHYQLWTTDYISLTEWTLDRLILAQDMQERPAIQRIHIMSQYRSELERIDGMSKLMMQVTCEGDLCILQQEVNLLEVDSMERRVLQKVVTCLEYYVALKNTTVMPVMKQATNALLACMRA